MKATATVPVRVGAVPVALGAKNLRTGTVYPVLQSAILAAAAGDTIEVAPGLYKPFAVTVPRSMTIKSMVSGQKFILDVGADVGGYLGWRILELAPQVSLTLEDAELRNNKQQYGIQSGVWPSFGPWDLIMRRVHIHDCCNGIIVGQHPAATVLMEDCEFNDNGDHNGQTHNIYIGTVAKLTMRRCYSHSTRMWGDASNPAAWEVSYGHLVKSRAKVTRIEDCRLTMETGAANRCVDLPNGGDVEIRGCMLEYRTYQNKGAGQFISYGVEEGQNFSANHPLHRLIVEDNIFVNRAAPIASTIWVTKTEPSEYVWRDNIFAGANMPNTFQPHTAAKWAIPLTPESGNRVVALTDFVDVDKYDWRLK